MRALQPPTVAMSLPSPLSPDLLNRSLDAASRRLAAGPAEIAPAIYALAADLRELKRAQAPAEWDDTLARCRAHPLCGQLHQDPLTARAYRQPRGYQGDAELLDIIYARDYRGVWREPVTALGESLFRHTIECRAPDAVRQRRNFLAESIDATCRENPAARILSVACGHLREATLAQAVTERRFGRFVGLDQDPKSVDVMRATVGQFGIEAVQGSVKTILAGALDGQTFDFIYSAGLYDYLGDRLAERLTARLFARLAPGGRLLIANYLPDIGDVGYMEAYMGWRLIYRNEDALRRLVGEIPPERIAASRVFPAAENCIAFLELWNA